MKTISSRHNPIVQRIREAVREHENEIAIEGRKAVADAIANGWKPLVIASTDSAAIPSDTGAQLVEITSEVFEAIAETRQPQGVVALFERPHASAAAILANRDRVTIALDAVQDPGNVGTIVRLAAAFDAAGVLLLPGCADAYGPKAIRASVGAILSVGVAKVTAEELIDAGVPLYATMANGERVDPPTRNAVLVFGNEGAGVSARLQERASGIAIPRSARVESRNVATSAAILLARSYATRG